MVKPAAKAEVNNFVQGLITEASPLNFPPNASFDEENYELNRDGTRDRRLGLGFEPDYLLRNSLENVSIVSSTYNTFKWASVGGDPNINLLVIQFGRRLWFFNMEEQKMSANGSFGSFLLPTMPDNVRYSFASVDGKLIVAAGVGHIIVVDRENSIFSTEQMELKTRDVWGVEVTGFTSYESDKSFRGAFDDKHKYNLTNQSWGIPRKNNVGTLVDPSVQYFVDLGKYPSNSEAVWAGLQFQPVTSGVPFERMYTHMYEDILGADIIAPKGYYINDVLRRGISRSQAYEANVTKYPSITPTSVSIPLDVTSGGASVVAEFAGRVFYAGFRGDISDPDSRSPNLSNYIFFSQLVKSKADIVKCYQEGDPSSRENNDIVETDGGFVRLAGAEDIIGMVNLSTHLMVITKNGVWSITGGSDFGFSATNLKVDKISSYSGLSSSSIVEVAGTAFFWGPDGIYLISKDQFGTFQVTNVTEKTIQTHYDTIDNVSKRDAIGVYDTIGKKVRWLYKSGIRFASNSITKELVLDTVLGAFSKFRIVNLSSNTTEALTVFASTSYQSSTSTDSVVVLGDSVVVLGDPVIVSTTARSSGVQAVRYLCVKLDGGGVNFTFGYYNNSEFKDWEESDGVGIDAPAFVDTGMQTAGDSSIAKQVPYVTVHFRRTESGVDANLIPLNQSGCFMRGKWDWSDNTNSKKWSELVQVYRYRRPLFVSSPSDTYDNGFDLITTKNKVRGRGRSFALHLETEPGKDCRIVGWNISLNGNNF